MKTSDLDSFRQKLTGIEGKFTEHYFRQIFQLLPEELRPERRKKFKSSARILTQSLRQAIRDADLVSEHVKIEVVGDVLKMSAVGDIGSAFSDWERGADELLELKSEEDSGAMFTLSYLKDIVGTAGLSSEVATLELTMDMPIRMDFELPQGKLVYYLAPCIGA